MSAAWIASDATEIAHAVHDGQCTATDVLAAQTAVIDRLEPDLHAYITETRDRAKKQATALDRGDGQGSAGQRLAGVPFAIKDIFDLTGTATTAAMAIRRDHRADEDATVVRRLEEAGAVILGKLTLTEGVYAEHRPGFPTPVNPWHPDYWPGASSSGSGVAVAGGLAVAALGSETGGSIKLPAAANGVTALKPTWGRVSRHGVFELAASLDHIGPFARSVGDVAQILGVIAGPDDRDPTAAPVSVPDYAAQLSRGIDGVRIGIDPGWIAGATDAVTGKALDDAVDTLRDQGAHVETVTVPDVNDMIWDWFGVCAAQTALAHRDTFPAQRDEYGPALAQLLDQGNAMTALEYQQLLLRRDDFRGRLAHLFASIDVLALPVLAFPVPTLERMSSIDDDLIAGLHRFTCPFNLSGSPGLILPCGVNSEGLPIVFQLIGRHFEEDVLLRAGAAYQSRTDWHRRAPYIDNVA